jgi:hypothetical protein
VDQRPEKTKQTIPACTADSTTTQSTMAERTSTPPPQYPPLAPVATVEPTEFSTERNESMHKLYELFEAEWKPMIVTQQQNNFTVGLNSSQVLEKLPEGKTFKFY